MCGHVIPAVSNEGHWQGGRGGFYMWTWRTRGIALVGDGLNLWHGRVGADGGQGQRVDRLFYSVSLMRCVVAPLCQSVTADPHS